ncbi:MAG: gene transfer agent family protein [Paracoccaceae bacterium]
MVNPLRGEAVLVIDGEERVLKLTLGALAELEASLPSGGLLDLIARFEAGQFSARDVLAIILAGLHGGGHPLRAANLLTAEIAGGATEAARVAGLLLARAFGTGEAPG